MTEHLNRRKHTPPKHPYLNLPISTFWHAITGSELTLLTWFTLLFFHFILDYGTNYEKNVILKHKTQNIAQENTQYPEDITQCAKGEMWEDLGFSEETLWHSGLSPLTRTEFDILCLCDYDEWRSDQFNSQRFLFFSIVLFIAMW